MGERWEKIAVDGLQMPAFCAWPEGDGRFPGVVIAIHGPGLDEFIMDICRRLAAAEYVAVAPDVYHRHTFGPKDDVRTRAGRLRDADLIKDLNAGADFLKKRNDARPGRLGVMGFCMGGRMAYMMAGVDPELKASVAFYGGNVDAALGAGPTPLERLRNAHCPILGFFGQNDTNPSPKHRQMLDDVLTANARPHEFHSYPGAGHGYMNFSNPERYSQYAAKASWPIALGFLESYLKA